MRKLVLFMHTSLDGYTAGPNGEMGWIKVDEEMFAYAGNRTNESDIALYGRVTYQLMEEYWPTAGNKPNATKHDIEHSKWYNSVKKIIVSDTMKDTILPNTKIIHKDFPGEIKKIKSTTGKDIIMFGSPSLSHSLMAENLIDEYWLLVNPIILGKGIPLFKPNETKINLNLLTSNTFASGVVCLHYRIK